MRIKLFTFTLLLSFAGYSNACGFITGIFTSEEISLEYVGDIELGQPVSVDGKVKIPFSFSGGRWLENSGRVFKKVKSSVSGSEIHITVVTCLASGGSDNSSRDIVFKKIASGEYTVIYINPNGSKVQIGGIKI